MYRKIEYTFNFVHLHSRQVVILLSIVHLSETTFPAGFGVERQWAGTGLLRDPSDVTSVPILFPR